MSKFSAANLPSPNAETKISEARKHNIVNRFHRGLAFLLLLAIVLLLAGAFWFQYYLNLPPCPLCVWQRIAYLVVASILILVVFVPVYRRGVLALAGGAFIGVSTLAFFHFGVEQGWWQGLSSCVGGNLNITDPQEIYAALQQSLPVRCDKILWQFLGLSMAGWNAIIALFLAFIAIGGAIFVSGQEQCRHAENPEISSK